MKAKRFLIFTLSIALGICLVGCGDGQSAKEEPKKPEVEWKVQTDEEGIPDVPLFDMEADGCHITSAVLMENGVTTALTEKELLQTVTEERVVQQSSGSADGDGFIPQKLTELYIKDYAVRITQIYEHASLIGLNSTDFERRLAERGDLAEEDVDQARVDEAVKRAYGLQTKGVSYASANDAESLAPSEGYTYAAILFIPKISAVAGTYQSDSLTYHYPCVNAAGFLDGIFLMIQSDKAENIPD